MTWALMIGFEKINRYKVLFLALLWLGYGTGCISSSPEIPSKTENENPPESPSQTSSEGSSESASQSSSQTPSKDSSESLSQSSTLTSPETSSEKLSESISQSSFKSPSQASSEGSPQASSEVNSQNQQQTSSEGPSESATQSKSQPLSEGSSQTSSEQSALQELESRLEIARKDLRISEATEARIASGLEQLKNSGNPSPETLEDYETYLGRAEEMVAENRKIVQELEALYSRYATVSSGSSASTDAQKVSNPKLPDEKEYDELGKLDRELNASLAVFDEMLLIEMDEIRTKSAEKMRDLATEAAAAAQRLEEQGVDVEPSSAEASSGARESAPESEPSESSPEKGEEGIQSESAGNQQEGSKGKAGGKASVEGERGRPSGYDDDIVARQIREAAEKETDPELKEKLWKEYEDYKKGSR